MNSMAGWAKPECRMMFSPRRFYAVQPRQKRQPKPTLNDVNGRSEVLNIQTNWVNKQNVNHNPQRVNEFKVQMLSECLYKHLYSCKQQKKLNSVSLEKARKRLRHYGLGVSGNYQSDVELKLPHLRGDIEEHFWSIGSEQSKPYQDLLEQFIAAGVPKLPKAWVLQPGWTKYAENEKPIQVQYPDEDAFVIDVEVCVKVEKSPVLATAVSSKAWYGWVSPIVVKEKTCQSYNLDCFIPLLGDKACIIVGHSVSYDRAYIKEEYNINTSGRRFLDIMALHISIGKFTSNRHLNWSYIALKELYQFYCNKILSKDKRSVFLTGGLLDVKEDFQNLMIYCANDSKAAFEVLQVVFPKFLEHFPHPVTLAGMLEMNLPYLPVNHNWYRYVKNSEEADSDLKQEMLELISRKTDNICRLLHNDEYKNDLWMWGESWETQTLKLTSRKRKIQANVENFADEIERNLHDKFKYLFDLENRLPEKRRPFLPGYPLWYRVLHEKTAGKHLSPRKVIMPKLLRLKWDNFPLHYVNHLGWGILIPDVHGKEMNTSIPLEKLKALAIKNLNLDPNEGESDAVKLMQTYYKGDGSWYDCMIDNCCYFYKLRNVNNGNKNVKSLLSKDFALLYGAISSDDTITKKVLNISEKISSWRKLRSLVNDEMVVWLDDERGVILPKVLVSGTTTRRAIENLWLNTVPDSAIGSELRSMVQAPTGYHIVGGYVDSDLWIASLFGDSRKKIHGSTPLGWVTLSGLESNINSIIARRWNLSMRQAEFLTTCRLYGKGVQTTEKHLRRFKPNLTVEEAKRMAQMIYRFTKGVKLCRMKNSNKTHSVKQALQLSKTKQKVLDDMFLKPFWYGGMESSAYNAMESLINTPRPTTPFLSSRLCEAYNEKNMYCRKLFSMIQSSGVDFLHLLLVCVRWLTNGRARYCFSFHNEVRYLIPSEDRYNGALALHVSCLLVKAFCSHKLGMYDLPLSVAFFPSVGVDTTLRKDVCDECVTPSNPHGLEKGYGIAPGETLDIYDAIEKSGGSLETFGHS